ncbi:GNAT family N-acetyltransferase [Flavobacterium agricola]|uniref:GNAT family N-acetyltransferase n=1 Tax=Flavobacterium agricola TaxID=2870839 RepID=A0ABY6M3T8_9FLAO|nr:GNAT family N-acetyltransferase [Flavobacterium agricola]UYW01896.1 GNAT family N-acetyltransferase [Flavobacterium agricola]
MNDVVIREYKTENFNNLCKLLQQNIPTYFAVTEYQDFVNYLNNEIENYFVAQINNTIVGCGGINYKTKEKTAMISWDIIHPEYQGKGIGKLLLNHRISYIKQNYPTYKIVVRTSQLVHKFYEKQGFKLLEIHKNFWADGFDMYKMEL